MEDWTEDNLFKLSVKELKSLARKSNVGLNVNYKKAELVQALLTNIKDTTEMSEAEENQKLKGKAKRMTRSRASMWQTSDEPEDTVKESKAKCEEEEEESSLETVVKVPVVEKKMKRKKVKEIENIDSYNTSEMFPLVSSIQLAPKPLLEITNKNTVKHEQDTQNEITSATTGKRTKRTKGLRSNRSMTEVISPPKNVELNKKTPFTILNNSLPAGQNKLKDNDRKEMFVEKDETTQNKRTTKKRKQVENVEGEKQDVNQSKPLDKQLTIQSDEIKNNEPSENLQDCPVEEKLAAKKQKRGKKTKSEPSEDKTCGNIAKKSFEIVLTEENAEVRTKSKRTRGKVLSEGSESRQILQSPSKSTAEHIPDVVLGLAMPDGVETVNASSNQTKYSGSNKRKISDEENSNDELQCNFSDPPQNKSKRKRGTEKIVNSDEVKGTRKQKQSKEKKQELPDEDKNPEDQELPESSQSTLKCSPNLRRNSRKNVSQSASVGESSIASANSNESLEKTVLMETNTCKENSLNGKDNDGVSMTEGETGLKTTQVPAPIRSSTFILSDSVTDQEQEMPVPVPRNATFTLLCSDGKSPLRKSIRFSPKPAFEKNGSNQCNSKPGKSIGHRIMEGSVTKQRVEKSSKREPGSTLKKNLTKSSTPGGSVFKKRPASKMPDFKKIHQQLFNNMESLSENKMRQRNRAQALLQSPIPRCAIVIQKPTNGKNEESSPMRKVQNTARSSVAPSPLASRLNTPVASRTPIAARKSMPVTQTPRELPTSSRPPLAKRTPVATAIVKPVQAAAPVNRFGFRRPVKKEEATSIVGKKLPQVKTETKKEQERNVLKGVRMNKRFMLQMQMRMGKSEK